jgi:hypothetical protein
MTILPGARTFYLAAQAETTRGDDKSGRKGPPGSTRYRVLVAIGVLTAKEGHPPTLRELAAVVGISYQVAQLHLEALERVGSVRQRRTPDGRVMARTIAVVERLEP